LVIKDHFNLENITEKLSLDCEMVMCKNSLGEIFHEVARISIVNYENKVVIDLFIKPENPIYDYLTWVSGITETHIQQASNLETHLPLIKSILKDRTIIGHTL